MATYWVRQDGDDLNDGSANDSAHAWLTIKYGFSQLVDSDTLYVVNVDNSDYVEENMSCGRSYITLEGIEDSEDRYPRVVNFATCGVFMDFYDPTACHHNTVRKLHFHVGGASVSQVLRLYDNSITGHQIVERCVFTQFTGNVNWGLTIAASPNSTVKFLTFVLAGDGSDDCSLYVGSGILGYGDSLGTVCRNIIFYNRNLGWDARFNPGLVHDIDYGCHYGTGNEVAGDSGGLVAISPGANSFCDWNANSVDPLLVDPAYPNWDCHLQATSPCIDVADPADDDGQEGTHWDRGAYEWEPAAVPGGGGSPAGRLMAAGLL